MKITENVGAVKQYLSQKLQITGNFRLREKTAEKLTVAYNDGEKLQKYGMHDDKEIAVQMIGDSATPPNSHLVMVKYFNS